MKRSLAALLTLAFAAGCSDTGTSPAERPLAPAEARALAARLHEQGLGLLGPLAGSTVTGGLPRAASAAADPVTGEIRRELTAPCPLGGEVSARLAATYAVDREAAAGWVEMDNAVTHRGCVVQLEAGRAALTGDPELRMRARLDFDAAGLTAPLTTTQRGAIRIEREGASLRCEVELTSTLDAAARTATVAGTVCGAAVSHSHAWAQPGS